MPIDINLILRKWEFDMDSLHLGSIRCAVLDTEKTFQRYREHTCFAEIDGLVLARTIFGEIARTRTGDEEVDNVAGGPSFDAGQVAAVTNEELEEFSLKLIARLRLYGLPESKQSSGENLSGCASLAGAIRQLAELNRASAERVARSIKSNFLPKLSA